jgi:hypothetical protein
LLDGRRDACGNGGLGSVNRIIRIDVRADVGHESGRFPADLVPSAADYVGYFANAYDEEMIFVQRRGEPTATVIRSDLGWKPVVVSMREGRLRGEGIGELIVDEAEGAWLHACWLASRPQRQAAVA